MKYLIDYLRECNKEALLDKITKNHIERSFEAENEDYEAVYVGYEKVLDRLFNLPKYTWYREKYKVWFRYMPEFPLEYYEKDERDPEYYIDVCMRNRNYEEPPEGLKPWGGKSGDKNDAPEGHYNCNYDNYNENYATSIPWRLIVNLEVDFDDSVNGIEVEELFAEFLYEITFDGFEEKSYMKLKKELKEITARIDSGEEKMIPWEDVKKELKDMIEDRTPLSETDKNYSVKISESAFENMKEVVKKDIQKEFEDDTD